MNIFANLAELENSNAFKRDLHFMQLSHHSKKSHSLTIQTVCKDLPVLSCYL